MGLPSTSRQLVPMTPTTDPRLHLVADPPTSPDDDLSDDDLMQAVRAGRKDALAILIRRHQKLVFALSKRFLGDATSGRDVVQDVFLSVWMERDRYRPAGRFRAWLVAMALNRCRMLVRSRRGDVRRAEAAEQVTTGLPPPPDKPLQELLEDETRRQVRQKLARLPEKLRIVVALRFGRDLALAEIAEVTKMPLGTVKSYLSRGLAQLHGLMTRDRP
jgi:RNA polymerase sigma factor (sigma-70 family)